MMNLLADSIGTIIEVALLFFLQSCDQKKRENKIILVFYMLIYLVIIILSQYKVSLIPKVAIIFLVDVLVVRYCYNITWIRNCFCFVTYLLAISVGEILGFGIVRVFFGNTVYQLMENPLALFLLLFFSKTATFAFSIYVKSYLQRAYQQLDKRSILIIVPLVMCFTVLFLQSSYIFFKDSISRSESFYAAFIIVLLICSTFFIIVLIEKYLKTIEIEKNTNLDIEQINKNYNYFSKKVESQEKVIELYHDLKNHLLILQANEEEPAYVSGLLEKIQDFELFIDTGNSIVNTIIYEKYKSSLSHQILFECAVDMNHFSVMKDFEICSIFGNALDNAIEACLKVKDSQERYISIKANKVRDFFIIKIQNAALVDDYDCLTPLKTSKENKDLHGYGLKSLYRTINKYNGEIQTSFTNASFVLNIAIPLSAISKS